VRSVSAEEFGDPRPAFVVLLDGRAADRAVLERVAFAETGDRPLQPAVDHHDRAAGQQRAVEEPFVGVPAPQAVDPEVPHPPDHQPVVVRVMHLVQREIRIRGEQALGGLAGGVGGVARLVGVKTARAQGQQQRSGQPRHSEKCG
jgi:hypothetical protein